MNTPLVVGRIEVAQLLDWTSVLDATRRGLLAAGNPRLRSAVSAQVMYETGSLHLKAASLDDDKILSVKSNLRPMRGGVSGVLLAYDLESEQLTGIIDAGLMTSWRTGAIAAIAVQRFVSRPVVNVAVLGTGPVGRQCARGIIEVLKVNHIRFWSHNPDRAHRVAEEYNQSISAEGCASVDAAIQDADVIVTATPATQPILNEQELSDGVIIAAMGADTAGKRELGPQLLSRCAIVADVPSDALLVGESAYLEGSRRNSVTPLSHWLSCDDSFDHGGVPLVIDSVGSSHVDAAVTAIILSRAVATGVGQPLQW